MSHEMSNDQPLVKDSSMSISSSVEWSESVVDQAGSSDFPAQSPVSPDPPTESPISSESHTNPGGPSDSLSEIVEQSMVALWALVNNLSRIKPPPSPNYRVTIFGSSRIRKGDPAYLGVRQLAAHLASLGCDIVTGGGPGLMEAANEGEQLGDPLNRTRSIGVRIALPFEQGANPFVEQVFTHQTFFSRLHHFVRLSNAFVVVPGGIGTTLETLMIWQLLQVKHLQDVPLILVGDMWARLVDWARDTMLITSPPYANPADVDLPMCCPTIDEACALLEDWIRRFRERGAS